MEWFWYFWIYSFLGYLLEIVFARATHSPRQVRKCFLVSPLCPVYGLAMVAVLLLNAREADNTWELIAVGAGAATAVEFGVHWAYEKAFGVHFWDYSQLKMDVGGRISLPFSMLWGLLTAFAVRVLQPYVDALAATVPKGIANAAMLLLVVDGMYSARILLLYRDTELLSLAALQRMRLNEENT